MNSGEYGMLNVPNSLGSNSALSTKEMNELLSEEDAKLLSSCIDDLVPTDDALDPFDSIDFLDFNQLPQDVGSPALNASMNRTSSIDVSPGLSDRMGSRLGDNSQSQGQAGMQGQQNLSQQNHSHQSGYMQNDNLLPQLPDLDMGSQHEELLQNNSHRMMQQGSLSGTQVSSRMMGGLRRDMRYMVRRPRQGIPGMMQQQANFRMPMMDDDHFLDDAWVQQQQRMEAFAGGVNMRSASLKQLQQRPMNPALAFQRQLMSRQQQMMARQILLGSGNGRQSMPQLSRRMSTGAPHISLMQRTRSVDYVSPLISSKSMQPGLEMGEEGGVLSAEGENGNAADDVTSYVEERAVESEAKPKTPTTAATEVHESKPVTDQDTKTAEPSSGSKRKTGSTMTSSKASAGTEGGQAADEDQQGDSAPNNDASRANEPMAKRKKKSQNEKIEELKVQVLELREQNQALKKKAGKLASDKSKILTCLTNLSMLVGQKKVENEMLKTKIAQLQEVVCEDPVNFQMKSAGVGMQREDCAFPQDMLSVFSQDGQGAQCR